MTTRVLVTGGTGFVGRHVLGPLARKGHDVVAVSRHPGAALPGVRHVACDLLDATATRALLHDVRPTHLLHLAWYAEHGKYWTSPLNIDWTLASVGLLRAFHETGGMRSVVVGTCVEYDLTRGICDERLTPLRPTTVYGRAKLALHELAAAVSSTAGASHAWARLFHLFGPDEHVARLVPSVVGALLRGERARASHGRQLRDYCHVEDAAAALVAILDSSLEGPVNVGGGEPMTIRTLLETVARLTGFPDGVDFGAIAAAPSDPPVIVPDLTRLAETGFRPRLTLSERLAAHVTDAKAVLG